MDDLNNIIGGIQAMERKQPIVNQLLSYDFMNMFRRRPEIGFSEAPGFADAGGLPLYMKCFSALCSFLFWYIFWSARAFVSRMLSYASRRALPYETFGRIEVFTRCFVRFQ